MDHRPHHHPVLLLRRRLGRLRLRVQQRLQQWLWLQQRLLLKQNTWQKTRARGSASFVGYQKFLKKPVTKTKIYRVDR